MPSGTNAFSSAWASVFEDPFVPVGVDVPVEEAPDGADGGPGNWAPDGLDEEAFEAGNSRRKMILIKDKGDKREGVRSARDCRPETAG